jgi:hypothetical protein
MLPLYAVTHSLSVFREVTAGAGRSDGLIPDPGAPQVPQRQPKMTMTGWAAKPSGDSVRWCDSLAVDHTTGRGLYQLARGGARRARLGRELRIESFERPQRTGRCLSRPAMHPQVAPSLRSNGRVCLKVGQKGLARTYKGTGWNQRQGSSHNSRTRSSTTHVRACEFMHENSAACHARQQPHTSTSAAGRRVHEYGSPGALVRVHVRGRGEQFRSMKSHRAKPQYTCGCGQVCMHFLARYDEQLCMHEL